MVEERAPTRAGSDRATMFGLAIMVIPALRHAYADRSLNASSRSALKTTTIVDPS